MEILSSLPDPPIPAYVDLRDTPVPIDFFIQMAMDQFGIGQQEAERMIRECAAIAGIQLSEIGHG